MYLLRMKIFIFGLIAVIASSGCTYLSECGEDRISSLSSPSGRYVAEHFARNCGATTGLAYHINLRMSTDKFSTNLSGTITEGAVITIRSQKLVMEWKNDKTLSIKCTNCRPGVKYKLEENWRDVHIAFDPGENVK